MAKGPILPFVPMECVRFRDMSQVTGAPKMRIEVGLWDFRLRPNREPSKHVALR